MNRFIFQSWFGNMMQRSRIIIILLLGMLTSCISQTQSEPTATFLSTVSQPGGANPTQTATLSPTDLPAIATIAPSTNTPTTTPTITQQPTSTPTLTPTPVIKYQNIEIEPDIPPGINLEGVLVMDGPFKQEKDFLFDLSNGKMMAIPDQRGGLQFLSISPDRKLLAYFDWTTDDCSLQVVTAGDQPISSFSCPQNSYDIAGWLDNEWLVINIINIIPVENRSVEIFNAYSGEWREMRPTFPLVSPDGSLSSFDANQFYERVVFYDPTLSLAVLHRYSREGKRGTLEIWDNTQQQIIWSKQNVTVGSIPTWSPDRETFALVYASSPELYAEIPSKIEVISIYLIDNRGIETKLTNRVVFGATWSPDGRYIATLWQRPAEFGYLYENANTLAIVDVLTKDVTVYSVIASSGYPIWSPDGRYVAVDNVLSEGLDKPYWSESRIVIVDLVENRAFEVARDVKIVGWMLQSP